MRLIAIILALATTAQAQQLADLKPLRKVHYSFGIYEVNDTTKQVLRICGSVPLKLNWADFQVISDTTDLASELKLPVGIQYSPWPRDRVPTGEPRFLLAELEFFDKWMAAASQLDIRAVFLDDERYDLADADCMLPYRNAMYRIARHHAPGASIEWYSHGSVKPAATDTGWSEPSYVLGRELLTDALSTSLYRPGEIEMQCESYRRTVAAAPATMPVTPWISFASGYRRERDAFHRWTFAWEYETAYDWLLGQQVNGISWYSKRPERYAPWDRARHVVLYPPICDPNVPQWLNHFIEYARGAQ